MAFKKRKMTRPITKQLDIVPTKIESNTEKRVTKK
jgi:hypothetical protein